MSPEAQSLHLILSCLQDDMYKRSNTRGDPNRSSSSLRAYESLYEFADPIWNQHLPNRLLNIQWQRWPVVTMLSAQCTQWRDSVNNVTRIFSLCQTTDSEILGGGSIVGHSTRRSWVSTHLLELGPVQHHARLIATSCRPLIIARTSRIRKTYLSSINITVFDINNPFPESEDRSFDCVDRLDSEIWAVEWTGNCKHNELAE